jgi:hypothetical protein
VGHSARGLDATFVPSSSLDAKRETAAHIVESKRLIALHVTVKCGTMSVYFKSGTRRRRHHQVNIPATFHLGIDQLTHILTVSHLAMLAILPLLMAGVVWSRTRK